MVTLVLAEEDQEVAVEFDSGISQIEVAQWHYHVPCAGVRYYTYDQQASPVEEIDPWALDAVTARL